MKSCRRQLSSAMIPVLMMSRQRSREQAEAVLEDKVLKESPSLLSEAVGLLVDQLIQDLMVLESRQDYEFLEEPPEFDPA